ARDRERTREGRHVAHRSEKGARRELRRVVDLARRVGRREDEVALDRDVVQLLHRVPGEVRGDRGLDRGELLVARRVLVERAPVAVYERVGAGHAVAGDELGEDLETWNSRLAAAEAER